MSDLFDPNIASRSAHESKSVLNDLVDELATHLKLRLQPTSYFIEPQQDDASSYGCNVDFRSALNRRIGLEACGVLCITSNLNEDVWVGAYMLLYLSGTRLLLGEKEAVLYVPRTVDGWQPVVEEVGEPGEWSQYETPARWQLTTSCS